MNNFQKIRFVAFTMLLAILMLTFNACTKQEIIKNPEPQFIQTPSATDSIHETRGGAEEFVAAVLVIAIKKFAGMQSVQWFFGGMNHTDWYVK